MEPTFYADFQNVDPEGRIRLNTTGTLEDLARRDLTLSQGQAVQLHTDDGDSDRALVLAGTVEFNFSECIWVAVVDCGSSAISPWSKRRRLWRRFARPIRRLRCSRDRAEEF